MYSQFQISNILEQLNKPPRFKELTLEELETDYTYSLTIDEYETYIDVYISL